MCVSLGGEGVVGGCEERVDRGGPARERERDARTLTACCTSCVLPLAVHTAHAHTATHAPRKHSSYCLASCADFSALDSRWRLALRPIPVSIARPRCSPDPHPAPAPAHHAPTRPADSPQAAPASARGAELLRLSCPGRELSPGAESSRRACRSARTSSTSWCTATCTSRVSTQVASAHQLSPVSQHLQSTLVAPRPRSPPARAAARRLSALRLHLWRGEPGGQEQHQRHQDPAGRTD